MRRGLFPGLLLILVGAYMLAVNFGMNVLPVVDLWPIFPIALGLFLLTESVLSDKNAIFPGTMFTLVGVFFFAFTLGYVPWERMSVLWPVFPLIMGVSFLLLYFVRLEWGLLIPTAIFLGTGLVFLGINFGYLNESVFSVIWRLWPVLLIILGTSVIVRHATRTKASDE